MPGWREIGTYSSSCASKADAEARCTAEGRDRFLAYRRAKLETIRRKGGSGLTVKGPAAYLHSTRTNYSVLLVHGLNDSAYYMGDLAALLYREGFNVITVLLPGHGTSTYDMLEVTAEEWRKEVEEGIGMASLVGRRVVLGGLSLGGTLAIDAALGRPDIHGLLLFSPAIRLRAFDAASGWSCLPGLREAVIETDLPPNPVKYKYRVGNGLCQLSRLMARNRAPGREGDDQPVTVSEQIGAMAARVRVPTFLALTYADARISPDAVLEFAGRVDAPVLVATFGVPDRAEPAVLGNGGAVVHIGDDPLPHSFLVRRDNPYNGQQNPYFDRLAEVLSGFLRSHFQAGRL